jgi:thioredoxin-dependent peroxiredoxin
MIDPPKTTKGRRMPKKTRKKSPNAPSPKPSAAKSRGSARASAPNPPRATASKPGSKAAKRASHAGPSKQLKTPDAPLTLKSGLREGAKAPAFHLSRDGGDSVSLSDYSGRKLVLFFYPRADTPGCTREAIDFTRLSDAFARTGTAILGISADPVKAQESFRDKHALSIALASDEKHEMLERYGAWGAKSMYGKTFQGIHRTTILIGADGRIARIWRNVRVDGHADEVLAAARAL